MHPPAAADDDDDGSRSEGGGEDGRVKFTFAPRWINCLARASRPMDRAIMRAVPWVEEHVSIFAPAERRMEVVDERPRVMASWRMVRRMVLVIWFSASRGLLGWCARRVMMASVDRRAARRGVGEMLAPLERRSRTASVLLVVTALKRTGGFLSRTAFTLAPRVRRASIRGVEGKRAELQRAWSSISWSRMSVVESSLRMERALGRSLLSMAEMSRFFRLEKPVAKDASRGLDLGFGVGGGGGGDRTPCCTSTSVVVSVSDLEKLPLEMEGEVELFGDSTASGPESSTTHCQDPYSRFGRLCPSTSVVPMTILAFGPSVMSADRLARKRTF